MINFSLNFTCLFAYHHSIWHPRYHSEKKRASIWQRVHLLKELTRPLFVLCILDAIAFPIRTLYASKNYYRSLQSMTMPSRPYHCPIIATVGKEERDLSSIYIYVPINLNWDCCLSFLLGDLYFYRSSPFGL